MPSQTVRPYAVARRRPCTAGSVPASPPGKRMFRTLAVTGMLINATCLVQAQEIHQRKENQQDRIGSGVKTGSLTPHETANLERQGIGVESRETRPGSQAKRRQFDEQREEASQSPAESAEPQYLSRQAQRRASVNVGVRGELARTHRRNSLRRAMASSRIGRSAA